MSDFEDCIDWRTDRYYKVGKNLTQIGIWEQHLVVRDGLIATNWSSAQVQEKMGSGIVPVKILRISEDIGYTDVSASDNRNHHQFLSILTFEIK